jgi:hypothetical protein
MRYVPDLDRFRTVRRGTEVDRRHGLGMDRRALLREGQGGDGEQRK